MKVIITGSGGFLGQALIKEFTNTDIEVCALTSQTKKIAQTYENNSNVIIYQKNALIEGTIPLKNDDVLINCAFPRQSNGTQMANGLQYVFETMHRAVRDGIGAIINISSQSVYDQKRKEPAKEDSPVCLDSMYAVGKYTTELFTSSFCSECACTNIRMASLIGPGFDQRVTNKMVDSALENGKVLVRMGNQRFGFLDVEDAVRGIYGLLQFPMNQWKKAYNLGTTNVYSLVDIAQTISDVFGKCLSRTVNIEVSTGDDFLNTALDCSRLLEDTGYQQHISLDTSIERILENKLEKKHR